VPPPVTGAFATLAEGRGLQPVRTAGATVAAEDSRRLLLMVAATVGLPETFFGDVSVGTLATAESLDRPTELRMTDRRTLWADVHMEILGYVLLQAVKAPSGPLQGFGRVVADVEDSKIEEWVEWNEDVDPYINIDFPTMVEADADKVISSIVEAATLKGLPLAGMIPQDEVTRMLLSALGEDDIDEILEELYPEGWEEEQPTEWEEESMADVMQSVKERLEKTIEKYGGER